jgi:hypothetical protein
MAESKRAILICWRQVDVTVGKSMATSRNLWNANDQSDGCYVEVRSLNGNAW